MAQVSAAIRLADATVQDIQFELIHRRWPGIAESLVTHSALWESAILDRIQHGQLRKLRSLRANIWNADELFILGTNPKALKDLLLIAEDDWDAFHIHVFDDEETEDLLGSEEDGRLAVTYRVEDYAEARETEDRTPMLWKENLYLREATIQDMQIELIGRMLPPVAADLLDMRELWQAVLLDRVADGELIKLRDLAENIWNTDELFILAADEKSARELYYQSARWRADEREILPADLATDLLGHDEDLAENNLVLALWWDDPYILR